MNANVPEGNVHTSYLQQYAGKSQQLGEELTKKQIIHNDLYIVHLLRAFTTDQFAGRVIREPPSPPQPQVPPAVPRIVRALDQLPLYCVPMMAKFMKPYTSDWLQAFELALEHADKAKKENTEYTIVIPIESPGGIVSELTSMLSRIQAAKAKGIRIITYGIGQVASCAFILFQAGDVAISTMAASYLCHEPTFYQGEGRQDIDAMEKGATSLQSLLEHIYTVAEINILRRLAKLLDDRQQSHHLSVLTEIPHDDVSPGRQQTLQQTIFYLRGVWFQQHQTDVVNFANSIRRLGGRNDYENLVKQFKPEHHNILEFVTRTVAQDPHNQEINPYWMFAMGLCDLSGVRLVAETVTTIQIEQEDIATIDASFAHTESKQEPQQAELTKQF